jgi:hypothetical protein
VADTSSYQTFLVPGLILIALGVLLIAIPLLARLVPSLERLPPILLWVYKSDGFYFATSPMLIIISVISIVLYFFTARS